MNGHLNVFVYVGFFIAVLRIETAISVAIVVATVSKERFYDDPDISADSLSR